MVYCNFVFCEREVFFLNINSRSEVGEDYALDFANNRYDVCLNTENFVGTDLFALKLILKRNPEKNIEFAKQFFSENTGDPTDLLDYDYQVKTKHYHQTFSVFDPEMYPS